LCQNIINQFILSRSGAFLPQYNIRVAVSKCLKTCPKIVGKLIRHIFVVCNCPEK
jgi:hypothetical protein